MVLVAACSASGDGQGGSVAVSQGADQGGGGAGQGGSVGGNCDAGYQREASECVDKNECLNGEESCHEVAACRNLPGTYSCSCPEGFTGDGKAACNDIDECADPLGTACQVYSSCQNIPGSYVCSCSPGYQFVSLEDAEGNSVNTCAPWGRLAAGTYHSCGIRAGTLKCWGDNEFSQLGIGTSTATYAEAQTVGAATDWSQITAAAQHSCGLRGTGAERTLWCWGREVLRELGLGNTQDDQIPVEVNTPTQVGTATDWKYVDTGDLHTCAIKQSGELYCWGDDRFEQLGNGTSEVGTKNLPQAVTAGMLWRQVSAGLRHTCGIDLQDQLWCWGTNDDGVLGLGITDDAHQEADPVQVAPGTSWAEITAGNNHSCGIQMDGRLFCWGSNEYGKLGIQASDTTDRSVPVAVVPNPFEGLASPQRWLHVVVGLQHTCGTTPVGTGDAQHVWCWGKGEFGRLGLGEDDQENYNAAYAPVVAGLLMVSDLTAGGAHNCAFQGTAGTSVFCWGANSEKQSAHPSEPFIANPNDGKLNNW